MIARLLWHLCGQVVHAVVENAIVSFLSLAYLFFELSSLALSRIKKQKRFLNRSEAACELKRSLEVR